MHPFDNELFIYFKELLPSSYFLLSNCSFRSKFWVQVKAASFIVNMQIENWLILIFPSLMICLKRNFQLWNSWGKLGKRETISLKDESLFIKCLMCISVEYKVCCSLSPQAGYEYKWWHFTLKIQARTTHLLRHTLCNVSTKRTECGDTVVVNQDFFLNTTISHCVYMHLKTYIVICFLLLLSPNQNNFTLMKKKKLIDHIRAKTTLYSNEIPAYFLPVSTHSILYLF